MVIFCFQTFWGIPFPYRLVIESASDDPFLHCGQYHIGTDTEMTSRYCVFLLSRILRLSVCKKDFSLRSK
ncbi:Uncharacterised protein [Bacteroides xylanisolvens]|nr:Uncharacterised protein [Bacteroides xylanisolvens]